MDGGDSLIMSPSSFSSSLFVDHKECQELVERIMDPGVCNPLIDCLVDDLYNFGLQPEVQNGKTIKLYAEYALNWSSNEENALVTLWTLLGCPKIEIFIDNDNIDDSYVYEGLWRTLNTKFLLSSLQLFIFTW
ncbi:hypothetical protein Sjap_003049 [Stephania japonica]|uniref:Uncharacterized protein n=1 Tax=Stephania japonica TaxID=461633 RepID=A0AAP0KPS0_9MAGN